MKPQFEVDENLPVEVLDAFRTAGYDAISAVDQGLGGAAAPEVADVCRREGRALLTLDLDFADIRANPPDEYPGVIVLRLARQDMKTILKILSRLIEHLASLRITGQLWIVEENRIRTRGGSMTSRGETDPR